MGAPIRRDARTQRSFEALAIEGGRVLALGDRESIEGFAGPETERIDLEGGVVFPGFHDAHLHLTGGALEVFGRLDLRRAASLEEVLHAVAVRDRELPDGVWLRGFGWDHTRWAGAPWPDRRLLDGVCPRRPVLLARVDGHVAWLNGAALERLGIGPSTPDPDGGAIGRVPDERTPTGILLERAMEQAVRRLPAEDQAERTHAIERAFGLAAACGITSLQDVAEPWALPILRSLLERGKLTARVSAWLPIEGDDEEADSLRRAHPARHDLLSVATRKMFLDGTLGSRSAALLEPYHDAPESKGMLRVDRGTLEEQVRRADAAGWAVAMHAIGDAAVRLACDVLESLPARARGRPHRIEHLQVVAPADRQRLARTGAIASVQPVHLADDLPWIEARLGRERLAGAYAWRSLAAAGVPLAFGTDWPIAAMDPGAGLHAAVARTTREEGPPFLPDEALSVGEALEAYTEGSARAGGCGHDQGRLLPGFHADFVVLAEDPLAGLSSLSGLRILETWVAGRRVHPPERAETRR